MSDERITGLAYDPTESQFVSDPTAYYRWLRDEQPVYQHEASGSILLSRFQDVWEATADWETFSSQSPVAKHEHMASMDPPGHDRLRLGAARWFTPARIAELEPMVREARRNLLDPLRAESRADLVGEFSAIFPSRVIHRMLGVPNDLDEPLRRCSLAIGGARDAATLAQGMSDLALLARQVLASDSEPEQRGLLHQLKQDQVVGIFDLVGFTTLDSNRDLVQAVGSMETSFRLFLTEDFWWGETSKSTGRETATNDILLRSTGDGYVLVFSDRFSSKDALNCLTLIHSDIARRHNVRLGVNRGENYVLKDLNDRINIIGWGINLAARALSRAEPNQILCTGYFSDPIIESDKATKSYLLPIGMHPVKHGVELSLYNCYKKDDFGSPTKKGQKRSAT